MCTDPTQCRKTSCLFPASDAPWFGNCGWKWSVAWCFQACGQASACYHQADSFQNSEPWGTLSQTWRRMPFMAQQHPGGPWCCQSLNGGSLAELLRFWCCQVQKLGKSRRIASFSNLQIDRFNGWMDGTTATTTTTATVTTTLGYSTMTTANTNANMLRYSALIALHYANYATLH